MAKHTPLQWGHSEGMQASLTGSRSGVHTELWRMSTCQPKGRRKAGSREAQGTGGGQETQVDTPRFLPPLVNGHQRTVPTLWLQGMMPLCPRVFVKTCVSKPRERVTKSRTAGAQGTTAHHPLSSPEPQAQNHPNHCVQRSPKKPNLLIPPELEKVLLPEATPSAQSGLRKHQFAPQGQGHLFQGPLPKPRFHL